MTRRRLLLGVLLPIFLLAAVDTLAWMQLQRLLDRKLDYATAQAAHSGWRLEAASERRGGWPFAATRVFSAPRLSHGGTVWSGERITAVLSPLHPQRIALQAGGMQVISHDGAGIGRSLRFWGQGIALYLPPGPGWFGHRQTGHVGIEAHALQMALPGAGPGDVMTAGGVHGLLRWNTQAHALTLTLHDVTLPQAGAVMIGNRLPDASLEMSLVGGTGIAGADFMSRVQAWRTGGGRLLLRQAALGWPGAGLEVSGQAALDQELQPDGGFAVRMTGADVLLDKLAQSGRVTAPTVSAIRAVLGLIAAGRNTRDGSESGHPLELWLTLRNGLLSLGQIPLLQVPPPFPSPPPEPAATLPRP